MCVYKTIACVFMPRQIQIIMFVQVSGFSGNSNITLPVHLRNPSTNQSSVTLALVRWLSPHPNAIMRDSKRRPVCPPPFDINHSLWTFSRTPRTRDALRDDVHLRRQLHLFKGSNEQERLEHVRTLRRARYDFIQPESIDNFMNCTPVDNDNCTVMETVTIPF